ncbi:hypothetical protein ANCDUO_18192, partial [Ancylostoma duodenale]
ALLVRVSLILFIYSGGYRKRLLRVRIYWQNLITPSVTSTRAYDVLRSFVLENMSSLFRRLSDDKVEDKCMDLIVHSLRSDDSSVQFLFVSSLLYSFLSTNSGNSKPVDFG